MEKITMTVKETAFALGISLPMAYQLFNSSGFPSYRMGKKFLVNKDDLNEWMHKKQRERQEAL